ncbi:hypothetical protein C8F04DRAFT_1269563 [Mycena alexandri]|uniref:Uncharacterized protein n=1 Tax=Mycena alexandri TaxID=1745969 RepID=A0AAD6SD73_9AGAR|nr:hypothetical protein C8F04DRAFT_1269563 [Mycena alexandri]
MRLMDPAAWEVEEAPSVVQGVDLLRNQRTILGGLDGRVAAHIEMGNTSYFVTTNTLYVPRLPEIDSKQIVIRRDMRFGPDDPVLWPRLYSDKFCHLPAIPKAPTDPEDPLAVMWWNPGPDDFVSPASGQTLTRGLGRIGLRRFSKFSLRTHALIDEYERYVASLPAGTKPPLLLPQLVQRLRLSLERLRIPSTYVRMVVGVTTVQREYLELTGLLRYMTKYRPRLDAIEDPEVNTACPDNCIGCFTDDPRMAQILWKVCLPCWLIRPLQAFADECILKMVVPFAAPDFLEMNPAAGFAPVPATDRLDDCLSLLHRCTENTPWYRNPFQDGSPDVASTSAAGSSRGSAGEQSARAHPNRNASSVSSSSFAPSSGKGSPYGAARTQSKARKEKGPGPPVKQARDKFLAFDRPEMPTTISPWASALAAVDRRRPPSCGVDLPQLYVMPEPALLASPEDEVRRRTLYHHYRLLRDALIFRLAYGDQPHALLTTQQWRDILQGKVTKQGKTGTRAQARSASLEDLLRPAFNACGIDDLTGFPVWPDAVPPLHVNSAKELLWELAEINFRYEFLALDARASGLDRPDQCRRCFASTRLIGMDLHESQRGLAALETDERLPYLLCIAGLMRDWSVPCERPKQINHAQGRTGWTANSIHELEGAVAQYYTESFYELFGRAAVVPMRLEHEIPS